MAKRTRLIKWTTTVNWANLNILLVADVVTRIKLLMRLRTDTLITAKALTATFGIIDDPLDEQILMIVTDLDDGQLPLTVTDDSVMESILENALWVDAEGWVVIGTDAGPTKLDDEAAGVELDRQYGGSGFTPPGALVAVVKSDTTSRIYFIGSLTLDIAYRQVTYNNDDAMFDQDPSELGL